MLIKLSLSILLFFFAYLSYSRRLRILMKISFLSSLSFEFKIFNILNVKVDLILINFSSLILRFLINLKLLISKSLRRLIIFRDNSLILYLIASLKLVSNILFVNFKFLAFNERSTIDIKERVLR